MSSIDEKSNMEIWESALMSVQKPDPINCQFSDFRVAKLTIVLVEFRKHPWLEKVLWNAAWVYGNQKNVALQVVCGRQNSKFVNEALKNLPGATKRVLEHDNVDIQTYNTLLTSASFYEMFEPCPSILIIQTDTLTRKKIPDRFVDMYSYIGAPWVAPQINGPAFCLVGNGGYSLRHVPTMKHACLTNKFDPAKDTNEDLFFAKHGHGLRGKTIATLSDAAMFSVEHVAHNDPCGMHQAWRFHPQDRLESWLTDLPGTFSEKVHKNNHIAITVVDDHCLL
jgi:hypothetical protein